MVTWQNAAQVPSLSKVGFATMFACFLMKN